jgi:DNA adenine methylase
MKTVRPLFKTSDDKWSAKDWLISQFPDSYENMTYLEPFGGNLGLVFCKKKSKFEAVNDQNKEIVNIYRAIRDEPSELVKKVMSHKCTPEGFEKAESKKIFEDYLDEAANDIYLRKTSKNGLKEKFQKPSNIDTWKSNIKMINDYSKIIKDVYIFNKNALDVIETFNTEDSFIYCDPPYLHENKAAKVVYNGDMSPETHMELFRMLNDFRGKVIISGCLSPLYKRIYKNWNMMKKRIDKSSTSSTEIIWKNF